ncbi:uncharacterized protein PV06_01695 [Exophiala oligosperma]|uniref:Uncharacterized protein n=1 Tax=Exophiala oligosperma TaxID=215243 RepID=A0A0D2B1K5_9EURO|nr:uncharacterized protein PV06_01695 [Exophiala oligosperma]KIW46001.1 hypothetical protein PV06_01695 [Exophiala oligosperma]
MASSRRKISANVDMGKAWVNHVCGPDEDIIPPIDHANAACGFQQESSPRICHDENSISP